MLKNHALKANSCAIYRECKSNWVSKPNYTTSMTNNQANHWKSFTITNQRHSLALRPLKSTPTNQSPKTFARIIMIITAISFLISTSEITSVKTAKKLRQKVGKSAIIFLVNSLIWVRQKVVNKVSLITNLKRFSGQQSYKQNLKIKYYLLNLKEVKARVSIAINSDWVSQKVKAISRQVPKHKLLHQRYLHSITVRMLNFMIVRYRLKKRKRRKH